MAIKFSLIYLILFIHKTISDRNVTNKNNEDDIIDINNHCMINHKLRKEIESYQPVVNKIISAVLHGSIKGKTYDELANFVDRFGSRLSGTDNLEHALDYMHKLLIKYKLENVHDEHVMIPHWERGKESAQMISPYLKEISILGLGSSVGTPHNGIVANIMVVKSFEELHSKGEEAAGKIVVYNQGYVSYGESVKYRQYGASEAAKLGAVAALVRSITPFSINSPHTGQQTYMQGVKKIPVACISIEDAEFFHRMYNRGTNVILQLYMEAHTLEDKSSKNVIGELKGSSHPESVVLVSGHIDSWDVGQGAMDDAGGAFISWFSVAVLKALHLRPKRTVRAVLWTAEEPGLIGAQKYAKAHSSELKNFNLIMESDEGTFTPYGLEFAGLNSAACIMQDILKLMSPLNATLFKTNSVVGSDITMLSKYGIPSGSVLTKNDRYFWYHHTNADMMTVENSGDLDKNVALHAAISYVVADLSKKLPRKSVNVAEDHSQVESNSLH